MRKRSRQAKLYLAQVGFASEVIDEGFGCQALIVGGVPRVHLDARVHDGHPVLLAAVQLLHKGLHTQPLLMSQLLQIAGGDPEVLNSLGSSFKMCFDMCAISQQQPSPACDMQLNQAPLHR